MKACRYCQALTSLAKKEHVAEIRDGALFIGGVEPTDQQLEEMAKESVLLERSALWKVLSETIKAQALDMGIRQAKDFDELMFAKAMLHVVEIQQSAIRAIVKESARRKSNSVV